MPRTSKSLSRLCGFLFAVVMFGPTTAHAAQSFASSLDGNARADLIVGDNGNYAVALSDGTKLGAPGSQNWLTTAPANGDDPLTTPGNPKLPPTH